MQEKNFQAFSITENIKTIDTGYRNDGSGELNYASHEPISENVFGGEFLGQRIFADADYDEPGFSGNSFVPAVQQEVGYHHIRWPGGDFVELKRDVDGDSSTPDEYAFSLTNENYVNENWIRGSGAPREGIREMLEFVSENELSLALVLPTDRYVEQTMKGANGAVQAAADLEVFLDRLFSGDFGPIPENLTLEIGSEYYNTDSWRQYTKDASGTPYRSDPDGVGPNGENLSTVFGEVFAAMASKIDEVQASHSDSQGSDEIDINVAVQGARFTSRSTDPNFGGEYEDNADFIAAFQKFDQENPGKPSALSAIDSIIWHRYITNWDQAKLGVTEAVDNNNANTPLTVSDMVADWQSAVGSNKELDLLLGFLSPTVNGSEHKLEHNETSLTYILQLTSGLLAEGMDTATIFGFGTDKFGSLAHQDDVFIGGSLWGLMSESLPGKRLVNGFTDNTAPVVSDEYIVNDSVNSYVFEDEYQVVVFLVAKDFGTQGEVTSETLDYSLNFDVEFSNATATYLSKGAESPVLRLNPDTGLMEPIGVFGNERNEHLDISDWSQGSSISVTFESDYELVRLVLDKASDGQAGTLDTGTTDTKLTNDSLVGSNGDDELESGRGNDTIWSGDGSDLIDGGAGDDLLGGGHGSDTIVASGGNDTVWGNSGADSIVSGSGDDMIGGGGQADVIEAGEGNDTVVGGFGTDYVDLGAGDDVFNDSKQDNGWGFDTVYGGDGNDVLNSLGGNDLFYGEAGNDTLYGGIGDDFLWGGDGSDVVAGDIGDDHLAGGKNNDIIDGGSGDDFVMGGGGFDTLNGGEGDDTLFGSGNWDVFVFEENFGNDVIVDFNVANNFEVIDLSAVKRITDFADLVSNHLVSVGSDAQISDGNGNSITLMGVEVSSLTEDEFLFL